MRKLFLSVAFILVFTFSNAQIVFSSNEKGELVCNGSLSYSDKSEKELLDCIQEHDMLESIKAHTNESVNGAYQYSYYASDNVTPVGEISFEYTYTIKKDVVEYTFYNFKHNREDSKIESVGILPLHLNERLAKVFPEDLYSKILSEQKFNIANWLKLLNRFCLN